MSQANNTIFSHINNGISLNRDKSAILHSNGKNTQFRLTIKLTTDCKYRYNPRLFHCINLDVCTCIEKPKRPDAK